MLRGFIDPHTTLDLSYRGALIILDDAIEAIGRSLGQLDSAINFRGFWGALIV